MTLAYIKGIKGQACPALKCGYTTIRKQESQPWVYLLTRLLAMDNPLFVLG